MHRRGCDPDDEFDQVVISDVQGGGSVLSDITLVGRHRARPPALAPGATAEGRRIARDRAHPSTPATAVFVRVRARRRKARTRSPP